MRVTGVRRPTGIAGPGLVMSRDYFIEQVTHGGIQFGDGNNPPSWKTTLYLSPIPPSAQPWILGDATYGLLGITTYLGF
jgi:hypothetical protein